MQPQQWRDILCRATCSPMRRSWIYLSVGSLGQPEAPTSSPPLGGWGLGSRDRPAGTANRATLGSQATALPLHKPIAHCIQEARIAIGPETGQHHARRCRTPLFRSRPTDVALQPPRNHRSDSSPNPRPFCTSSTSCRLPKVLLAQVACCALEPMQRFLLVLFLEAEPLCDALVFRISSSAALFSGAMRIFRGHPYQQDTESLGKMRNVSSNMLNCDDWSEEVEREHTSLLL